MFAKDPTTGVVHNFNDSELKTNLALRQRIKNEKQYIKQIDDLTVELSEIKELIQEILDKRKPE